MKAPHNLYGKKLLPLTILLLLTLSLLSALNINMIDVSAAVSWYIKVVPESTVDTTLKPGENFTVSIYTDYPGPDVTAYQFVLSYNSSVLFGGLQKTDWDTWLGNNVTKTFNASLTPVVLDSEEVYVNEILMNRIRDATDIWTGDGAKKTFFITQKPIVPDSQEVYVNKSYAKPEVEYTINYDTGNITFTTAPDEGVEVKAEYEYGHYSIEYKTGEIIFTTAPDEGVEVKAIYLYNGVVNGDLIVGDPIHQNPRFIPGVFNNTNGELSMTVGYFYVEGAVTNGPGTFANVTFTVVGKGACNIVLGPDTKLIGWDDWLDPPDYVIPTELQHGYFDNRFMHDVAVVGVTTNDQGKVGELVPISVEVKNIGKSSEVANVTISYDSTYIDSQNVALAVGETKTVSFDWDTTGVEPETYKINATATIEDDGDPTDNSKITTILILAYDVAIDSVTAPKKKAVGELVPINVTVRNEGSEEGVANVTISYDSTYIDSQNVALAVGETKTVSFDWDTTGVEPETYKINATATIEDDGDPTDNSKITTILILEHDVTITSLDAPAEAAVGELVPINVTVKNLGSSEEDVTVTVSYISEAPPEPRVIDKTTKNITLAAGANTTCPFSWNTTGLDSKHPYKIDATATIEDDGDPTDNSKTKKITLKSHNIKVMKVQPDPYKVFVGELVEITVEVRNLGVYTENFTMEVTYGINLTSDITIGASPPISLSPNSLASRVFTWNTTGVTPASYVITAEAILAEGVVDAKPDDNVQKFLWVFVNPPIGTIAGMVKDVSTGLPILGADITAGDYSATTDANGHYNISDVPAGTYTVTASATGYEDSSQTDITVIAGEITPLNFTLTPLPTTGTIDGTVKDSSTGDPIADVTVTANGRSATTDSSGAYTISDVPAGTYTVTASATGYEDSSQTDITVVAGQTTTVDFELTPTEPEQPLNILLYAGAAAAAIIVIAAIAVYVLKVRKPT